MKKLHRHQGQVVQAGKGSYVNGQPFTYTVLRCDACGRLVHGPAVPGHWRPSQLDVVRGGFGWS